MGKIEEVNHRYSKSVSPVRRRESLALACILRAVLVDAMKDILLRDTQAVIQKHRRTISWRAYSMPYQEVDKKLIAVKDVVQRGSKTERLHELVEGNCATGGES
jgi:hypothetical protein